MTSYFASSSQLCAAIDFPSPEPLMHICSKLGWLKGTPKGYQPFWGSQFRDLETSHGKVPGEAEGARGPSGITLAQGSHSMSSHGFPKSGLVYCSRCTFPILSRILLSRKPPETQGEIASCWKERWNQPLELCQKTA